MRDDVEQPPLSSCDASCQKMLHPPELVRHTSCHLCISSGDDDDNTTISQAPLESSAEELAAFETVWLELPERLETHLYEEAERHLRISRVRKDVQDIPIAQRTFYLGYDSEALLAHLEGSDVPGGNCSICIYAMTSEPCYSLPCGYSFHLGCITHWFKEQLQRPVDRSPEATCPFCRARLSLLLPPPNLGKRGSR